MLGVGPQHPLDGSKAIASRSPSQGVVEQRAPLGRPPTVGVFLGQQELRLLEEPSPMLGQGGVLVAVVLGEGQLGGRGPSEERDRDRPRDRDDHGGPEKSPLRSHALTRPASRRPARR
jgi:hypothetical protein